MPDFNFLMETRFSPDHFQVLSQIGRWASEEGVNLYLVGGAVRDLTYGQHTIQGLDFVVEGPPQKILRHLSAGSGRARPGPGTAPAIEWLRFNKRLNAAEFKFANGVRGEIAMSRSETFPRPGRPPAAAPAMIFDDLKRRDFSVNCMAVSLHPNSRGLLLDPTNGAADIEKRELRVLHRASLADDPLRIYRLFRLGRRLGFKPEEKTRAYLEAALENGLWTRLDPVAQGRELRAILYEPDPGAVLRLLAERGLLAGLDRKLAPRQILYEQFRKIRAAGHHVPGADPFLVNFHCLVSKFGAGQRKRLAKKIIADRHALRMALGLERGARKLARQLSRSRAALPSQTYKLLEGQPKDLLLFLLVHYPAAKVQNRVKHFLHRAPAVRAALPRAELLALGAKGGAKFEKILDRLFFDQLDGRIRSDAQLRKEFCRLAGIPEPKPSAKPPKAKTAAAPQKPPPAQPAKPAGAPPKAQAARPEQPGQAARAAVKKKSGSKHAAPRKRVRP